MSWTKLRAAHIKGRPVRIDTKTIIPVCESGARPSGVEDPTMREYRFILIIIRLLIKKQGQDIQLIAGCFM